MSNSEIQEQLKEIRDLLMSNKKVLNLNEVAKYIGYSKSHIYKLTSTNQIPHSKPNGKGLFFDKDEIDTWLLTNRVETRKEVNKKIKKDNKGEWGFTIEDKDWPDIKPDWKLTENEFTKEKQ